MSDSRQELALEQKLKQERDRLHKELWDIADSLRGSVDGWDFKAYVLGLMFYRFLSENLTDYINQGEWDAEDKSFDYAMLSDEDAEDAREDIVASTGFFILPSELFGNVLARLNTSKDLMNFAPNPEANKDDPNSQFLGLNEFLKQVFEHIENSAQGTPSEEHFKGLFADIDVDSNKLGSTPSKRNEKLKQLLIAINKLQLSDRKQIAEKLQSSYADNIIQSASVGYTDYHTYSIDAFGDAYEYLMSMYASQAGKSGGEFFTPHDVAVLLAKLVTAGKKEVNTVYDPACGSGSLLLQVVKVLGEANILKGIYGQEINHTTYNLCRINMILHDVGFDKFNIVCEDTLTEPEYNEVAPFDIIVSNPPYSIEWEGADNASLLIDPRFTPAGVLAPKNKADMAFIMHIRSYLAPQGTAAVVCFPGVMYRGGAEKQIRSFLVDENLVDCVIQLPSNLFFGTSIATCIMVLKKNKQDNHILFIDASKEFVKVGKDNRLTQGNIEHIVEAFKARKDVAYFVHSAPYEEVVEHDYNLSPNSYIESEDTREQIDIAKVNAELKEIVASANALRQEIDKFIATVEVGV